MRRLRSSIALVLLALWLPASLCCELDMADVFAACAACQDDQSDGGCARDCDADGCALVENAAHRPSGDAFVLKPPTTTGGPWLVVAVAPPCGAAPLAGLAGTSAPQELARTWQFIRRAAPPPRAPSVVA